MDISCSHSNNGHSLCCAGVMLWKTPTPGIGPRTTWTLVLVLRHMSRKTLSPVLVVRIARISIMAVMLVFTYNLLTKVQRQRKRLN